MNIFVCIKYVFLDKLVDDNLNISNISNFEIYEDEVESVKTNMNLFSDENVFGNTELESNDQVKISPFLGGRSQGSFKYFCVFGCIVYSFNLIHKM